MDDKDIKKSMPLQEECIIQPRTRPTPRRGLMPARRNSTLNASVIVAGDGSAHSPVLHTVCAPSGQAEGLFDKNTKMQTNDKTSAAEHRTQPHTNRRYRSQGHCWDSAFQSVFSLTGPVAVAGGDSIHGRAQDILCPVSPEPQPLDLSWAGPSGSQDPGRTVDKRSAEHKGSNKRISHMDTSMPQHGLSSSRKLVMENNFGMTHSCRTHREEQGRHSPQEQQQGRHSPQEQQQGRNSPQEQQQGRYSPQEQPKRHSLQEQQGRHSPQEQQQGRHSPQEQQHGRYSLQEQLRRHILQEQQGRPREQQGRHREQLWRPKLQQDLPREHYPPDLLKAADSLNIMPNQVKSFLANQEKSVMMHSNGYENDHPYLMAFYQKMFNIGNHPRQGYTHGSSIQRPNSMMNQRSANAPIGAQSNGIDMPYYGMGGQLNRWGSTSTTSISPNTSSPPLATTESSHLPMEEDSNQNFSSISPSGTGPRHGVSIQNTNSMTNHASANSAIGAQSNGMGVQLNTWGSSPSPSISPNTSSPPLAATVSSHLPMGEEEDSNQNSSSISPSENEPQAPSNGKMVCKKRARSTMPDEQKDAAYWAKRKKNNEAAKRSRDNRRAKEDQIARRAALLREENIRFRIEMQSLQNEIAKLNCILCNRQI